MTDSFDLQDDHELWYLLSSGDVTTTLDGFAERFNRDHVEAAPFWQNLLQFAEWLGFEIAKPQVEESLNNNPTKKPITIPASFETTSGKRHVKSLSKVLAIDEITAVQLTLGALQSVNTENHLQSLLGKPSLLLHVLEFYSKQRFARLGIVTELLRGANASSAGTILDELDEQVQLNHHNGRGIFQKLLFAACRSNDDCHSSTAQLTPLLVEELGQDDKFVHRVVRLLSEQRRLEREQAMEALLSLFYQRLEPDCCEFCLLLLALQQQQFFTNDQHLAKLAGLLCAEAVSLNSFGPSHKFNDAKGLEIVKTFAMNLSQEAMSRRQKHFGGMDASVAAQIVLSMPESIAVLAIGLLLKLHNIEKGLEYIEIANECGALEYLQTSFETLLSSKSSALGEYYDPEPYDIQFSDPKPKLQIESNSNVPKMDSNVVIYSSIGLEILNGLVVALGNYLNNRENISALCHLGATLFANEPMLCEDFWRDQKHIGRLVEAAFDTASFLEILASLCWDYQSVDRVMSIIPEDYIIGFLEKSSSNAKDFSLIVDAMGKMARFNPVAIRNALNDDPCVPIKLLSFHSRDEKIMGQIFTLLSALVEECPPWAVTAITFFGARSSNDVFPKCFGSDEKATVAASARLLHSLSNIMGTVCFSPACKEEEVQAYINVTLKASLAACDSLSTTLSKPCDLSVSYIDAHYILKSTNTLLDSIRRLDSLHNSLRVREVASEARRIILERFATSTAFGQMVAYFAAAPISLSLCIFLKEALQEAKLVKFATQDFANDGNNASSEKWHAMMQQTSTSSYDNTNLVLERLNNMKTLPIDMNGIHSRGWSDSEYGPLHAAASALKLIKTWFAESESFAISYLAETRDLSSISPFSLLTASATIPPATHGDPSLENLWPKLFLRTSDLLVYYATVLDANDYVLPFWGSLDLLSLLMSHAKYCGGMEGKLNNAEGVLFMSIKDCLSKISNLLSDKPCTMDKQSETIFRRGIAFVCLLNNLFEADKLVAMAILDNEDSVIAKTLIDSIKALALDYSNANEVSYRERFVAESLSVIRSSKKYMELLQDLVKLLKIRGEPSIVRSELAMQSLKILTDAMLVDDTSSDLKEVIREPSFYEHPLRDFRACVISTCSKMSEFKTTTTKIITCMNLSSPSLFAQSFPSVHRSMPFLAFGMSLYDIQAAVSFLCCFENQDINGEQIASATEAVLVALTLLKKQFEAVSFWTSFAHGCVRNNKSYEQTEKIAVFLLNELYELAILKVEVEEEFAPCNELEAVIESTSTLLLHFVSLSRSSPLLKDFDISKVLKTMDIVVCGTKFSYSKVNFTSLSNVLGISTILLQESQMKSDLTKFVNITRQSLLMRREEADIFRQSLSLLAVVLDAEKLGNNSRSCEKLAHAMEEQKIIESLVEEILNSSARAISNKQIIDEEEVIIVLSILKLLQVVVDIGEREHSFISLCVNVRYKISRMLIENPLYTFASSRWEGVSLDSNYRGYIKSSSNQLGKSKGGESGETLLSGRSDVVHNVWRFSIRLLASLVEVESLYSNTNHFSGFLDAFTKKYDNAIRSCMSHCSLIGQGRVLTRNVLAEAYEILNLLSVKKNPDEYTDAITSVVVSFGNFLGFIGTARLLPKLVRDMETAIQDQDNQLENAQEVHPALAKGFSNASREAYRYAHIARSSYAIVTSDDYTLFSKEESLLPFDVKDLDDFKVTCYKAINNSFAKEIENAVARCLTSALTFLSKNHPAAKCFVPFSKEESANLNPMSIVKVGSIIAFYNNGDHNFARVVKRNTVERTWECKVIPSERGDGGTELTVSADDLAGVEDQLKRKVLLRYSPAPDSAPTKVGEIAKIPNLGHLILALRWCRREENGIEQATRRHLAETASAVLATELALHREVGTIAATTDAVKNLLNDQLFDLFDEDSKNPWLKSCMDDSLLLRIQRQVAEMLDSARSIRMKERELAEARLAAFQNANPWRD